ncbi:MAG: lycopene cyclase domain-containing protein [Flavobacteriaceae bacterium]|nr:lycopene cyclase domain-containing protein [Flavobacteriaceae bacterium]NNL80429.1 lycopene cyclase domain-containing protein [Flavobacteriaceae bacterium]
MKWLYLCLNLGSIAIPFLFSFHPKLKFYKYWKALLIAMILTMVVFIPWDVIFTSQGFWGFNTEYYLSLRLFELPIEEWLFFICIPYACVFTHYALLHYLPNLKLNDKWTRNISYVLMLVMILIVSFHYDKWYTFINYGLAIILIPLMLKTNLSLLSQYYITFLVMLVPFFFVNGILTGSFIEDQVVWYNNDENLGIRMFTIPVEDSIYAFTLIGMNLFLTDYFYTAFSGKRKMQS